MIRNLMNQRSEQLYLFFYGNSHSPVKVMHVFHEILHIGIFERFAGQSYRLMELFEEIMFNLIYLSNMLFADLSQAVVGLAVFGSS